MGNRRFAGARLAAGVPLEDITQELKELTEQLQKENAGLGFSKDVPVPGINENVHISGSSVYMPTIFDEDRIIGNKAELQKIRELNSPGIVELAWSTTAHPGDDTGTKMRAARTAERAWSEQLKELPTNTIVRNTPVGATSGDFERADLYLRKGFGPLMSDGYQYGYVKGGKIEPLSPFKADAEHLRHLADRAYASGDMETNDVLRRELNKRLAENLNPESVVQPYKERRLTAEDYDYDDGEYYDEPTPATKADLRARVIDSYTEPQGGYGSVVGDDIPPEIGMRRNAEMARRYPNRGDYQPTPEDLAWFREQQIRASAVPSGARDQIDVINDYRPRPIPPRITAADLQRDRSFDELNNWRLTEFDEINARTLEGRRAQMIDALRASQSGISATGYDHDPSVVRDRLKRAAVTRTADDDLNVVLQENYLPEDVAALRAWQESQALNWPISNPPRTPPPTLNADGTFQSRRVGPENAVPDSVAMLSSLPGRDPIRPNTPLINRRALTPTQEAAAETLAEMRARGISVNTREGLRLRAIVDEANYGPAVPFRRLQSAEPLTPREAARAARSLDAQTRQELLEDEDLLPVDELRAAAAERPRWDPSAPTPRRRPSRRPVTNTDEVDYLLGLGDAPITTRVPPVRVEVDPTDVFVRPTGVRAIQQEALKRREISADDAEFLEALIEGY
ncbi:hypothetical protein SynBIOSE41_00826 [Synechococcus sp. BIOS-E4-1]|uniref:hypothetical protein n=1 Tax=Synechococcus sp. BIOS-E4-1 TaxID=1400864 RepID=UPI00164453A7|nr:hypothetical protein [Synechococcus sp. BIOS-E4-1]QNI53358.1 hypothetical protein SynBIOSE41_00826 [Synechococcus sp. BIOS-E4-1]